MASVLDLVGNTPMVEIKKLNPNPKVKMYAKLEGNNPGGSVKDRPALNMIRSALERGEMESPIPHRIHQTTCGKVRIDDALHREYSTESWCFRGRFRLAACQVGLQQLHSRCRKPESAGDPRQALLPT